MGFVEALRRFYQVRRFVGSVRGGRGSGYVVRGRCLGFWRWRVQVGIVDGVRDGEVIEGCDVSLWGMVVARGTW